MLSVLATPAPSISVPEDILESAAVPLVSDNCIFTLCVDKPVSLVTLATTLVIIEFAGIFTFLNSSANVLSELS